jgi:hypothetical protein
MMMMLTVNTLRMEVACSDLGLGGGFGGMTSCRARHDVMAPASSATPRRRSVFLPQALLAAWHDQEYHRLRTGPVSLLQMVLFLPVILAPHSPRSDTSPAPCWPPTRRVNGSLRSPFTPPKNTLHHHHHPHRHHHPSLESAGGTGRGYSCGVDGSLRSPSTPQSSTLPVHSPHNHHPSNVPGTGILAPHSPRSDTSLPSGQRHSTMRMHPTSSWFRK